MLSSALQMDARSMPANDRGHVEVYEVQKNVAGQWRSYALFDEKTLAIDATKDLMSQKNPPTSARVLMDRGDGTPPQVIFRKTTLDAHNEQAHHQRLEVLQEVETQRAARQQEKTQSRSPRPQQRKAAPVSWNALAIRATLLATVGIAIVVLVRHSLLQ